MRLLILLSILLAFTCSCASTGATKSEKQNAILKMADETLAELVHEKPHVKQQINASPGYAVFSNANVNIILASFGGGHGVVKNTAAGKTIFMRMGEVGVGVGAGVKDYRLVMIFQNQAVMDKFIDQGWVFGAQADAAAKASDAGGAAGGEAVVNGIAIYQLTEAGLALQATVKGTKFWRDESLN